MRNNKTSELVLTSLFTAIIIIMAFTPLGYIPLVVINATIIHIPVILGSLFCGPKKGAFLGFVFGFTSFIKNTIMPSSLSAFVFSPVLASSVVGTAGIFKSLFICFVPRILVGVLPYFVYMLIKKALSSESKKLWGIILNLAVCVLLGFGLHAFIAKMSDGNMAESVNLIISIIVAAVIFVVLQFATMKKDANVLSFVYAGISGAFINTLLVMGGIFVLYKDAYANALSIDANAVLGVIGGVISFNGVIEAIVAAVIVYAIGAVLTKIKPIK
ncbi:ECF transporter S component [Roseburia sp. MUC/MUC-530-WT-4D]|uniref:ECF transporter S component n=1 Tax=Roseburia porci TaxID=2605790 RepID=A0A6L5YQI4_9FIRM|nr:ECF transporter S component [Roseburia porci]MCI5517821.1 ECF transporter S component [Roseburia sp.]MDD6741901.1 ECF transporter S component [Roseburia porci]MST74744.1 ECF transporter S component [Roseburia porci]